MFDMISLPISDSCGELEIGVVNDENNIKGIEHKKNDVSGLCFISKPLLRHRESLLFKTFLNINNNERNAI